MPRYEVTISSPYLDLHGVLLRETLTKQFGQSECRGTVHNVAHKNVSVPIAPTVVLQLEAPKNVKREDVERQVRKALGDCPGLEGETLCFENGRENIRISFAEPDSGQVTGQMPERGVFIKRGTDAQETVWALKGAGKVFIHASELQRKVLKELQDQRNERMLGSLLGLANELNRIHPHLEEIHPGKPVPTKKLLRIPALERFLIDCPLGDDDLMPRLVELRGVFDEIDDSGSTAEKLKRLEDLIVGKPPTVEQKGILGLSDLIGSRISALKTQTSGRLPSICFKTSETKVEA